MRGITKHARRPVSQTEWDKVGDLLVGLVCLVILVAILIGEI